MCRLLKTGLRVGGLLAAWLGVWGAWLAHPSAGLTQSALDAARVAQRLPDVLYGRLSSVPDLLRGSVGLAALALSLAAGELETRWLRRLLHALALLLVLRLLPPYPHVLELWRSPDYGGRFLVAALMLAGWAVTLTGGRWPAPLQRAAVPALGLISLAGGLWAYVALRHSFAAATQLSFAPGWGLALYVAGLLAATAASLPARSSLWMAAPGGKTT